LQQPQYEPARDGERRGLSLRFRDPQLERQFLNSYRASARVWVRLSLLVALSSVCGFAIIDHVLLVGPRFARADVWRFGLQFPLVFIMLVLTRPRWYARYYQPAIQVAAPLFGAGTVLMAIEATAAQLPLVAARLLLATFYFYFMLGMTFGAAVRTNALLVSAYALAALFGEITPTVAIYSLFVLFSANLIGGAGSYALEHANRVAFLERRRLAQVAAHDGLTGLLNRSALEEHARALWQHAQQRQAPVAVLLMDIDHFTAYNDLYGHQAGDRCLQQVAAAIQGVISRRPLDLVARYGGEEMIAILSDGDRAYASAVAREVLAAVNALALAHGASPTRPCVTVSIGVSTVAPGEDYLYERAVRCADLALYGVKARGRADWAVHESAGGAAEPPELLQTAS
jgi:diguanylate cyclase (GGDEF)-like protein